MGCRLGPLRAQSPDLLESEPGMMVGLGSIRNSLLGRSIHRDNLHTYEHGITGFSLSRPLKKNNQLACFCTF